MSPVNQTENSALNKDESNGQTAQVDKVQYEYLWIINEGLLRDEGTLFGIAGAPYDEKVNAIREYFNAKKAQDQQRKDSFEQEFKKELSLIESCENEINQKWKAFDQLVRERKSYNLGPITFQIIAYLAICYFNYYLVSYWLTPGNVSSFICLGLYLFGLFSVFLGRSIMYNSNNISVDIQEEVRREKWKVFLEEIGIPVVVSAFICILTFRYYPVEYSVGALALFILLFLFSGKALINLQFRLKKEFSLYWNDAKERQKVKKQIQRLDKKKDEIEKASATKRKEVQEPLAALKALEAEEAYKIHVFMSEYNLAFETRPSLDDNQLRKLA